MIAAQLTPDGVARAVERPDPRAYGDIVVVRNDVTPMCTEFKSRGDGATHDALGHEAVGVVVDAGTSRRVTAGDRVVVMPNNGCGLCRFCSRGDHIYCRSPRSVLSETGSEYGTATYAQFVLKPDYVLLPIPDDISLEHAAAAVCLLGPSLHACERMGVDALDTLLVSGCGPVGLGAIVNGLARGARVLALETNPYRMELARAIGAEVFDALDPDADEAIRAATGGWGVTASIETSGVPTAARRLAGVTIPLGQLAVVAWGPDVTLPPIVPLGLTVHGCWHWNHAVLGERMWDTIRRSRALIDTVVTHRFDLTDVDAAMDVQATGQCGKVFLYPNGRAA